MQLAGQKEFLRLAYFEDAPVKRAGISIIISASSTSLPHSIIYIIKYMRYDIRSLNTYIPSEVSIELDLLFDRFFTFKL